MLPIPPNNLTITTSGGIGSVKFNVSFNTKCIRRNITPATGSPTYNWYVKDNNPLSPAFGQIIDSNSYPGQGFMIFADNSAPYAGNMIFTIQNASSDMAYDVCLWYDWQVINS